MIEINGKKYELDDLSPEQHSLLTQLRLAETLGEVMNQAHDRLTQLIVEAFDADETDA